MGRASAIGSAPRDKGNRWGPPAPHNAALRTWLRPLSPHSMTDQSKSGVMVDMSSPLAAESGHRLGQLASVGRDGRLCLDLGRPSILMDRWYSGSAHALTLFRPSRHRIVHGRNIQQCCLGFRVPKAISSDTRFLCTLPPVRRSGQFCIRLDFGHEPRPSLPTANAI